MRGVVPSGWASSRQPYHLVRRVSLLSVFLISSLLLLPPLLPRAHAAAASMGYGRRQGGEAASQVRGEGKPSASPSKDEKSDPVAAVGRRLGFTKDEIKALRAAANAVPLQPGKKKSKSAADDAAMSLLMLVDQALAAPDYATLGKGWFYPDSRMDYRRRVHNVFTCAASRARQLASAQRIAERLRVIVGVDPPRKGASDLVAFICATFIDEIGAWVHHASPPPVQYTHVNLNSLVRAIRFQSRSHHSV